MIMSEAHEEEAAVTAIDLQTLFIYQNNQTGAPSSQPITCQQLVRILCCMPLPLQLITADTNLLHINENHQYVGGWRPARSFPVLQQAVAQWYYETDGAVLGPVSCRELAALAQTTRVYSNTCTEWKAIQDVTELQVVLQAFETDNVVVETPEFNEVEPDKSDVQMELAAFLASSNTKRKSMYESDDESYASDGGTRYVKDPEKGNWIHEDLAPSAHPRMTVDNNSKQSDVPTAPTTKKKKKAKFAAKHARNWIYVSGLPTDTSIQEVEQVFSKAGIIDLDPETQRPKIKLYRHDDTTLKGDASICYARPESVELALTLLDDAPFRSNNHVLSVVRAKFVQRGDARAPSTGTSHAKRQVVRLAAMQATDWDEGEFNGRLTGGRKGLRILVLKHVFDNATDHDDKALETLIRSKCEEWGTVEKITIFASNPEGVVIVKFAQPGSASDAVKALNGSVWGERTISASFWDGATDYTVVNTAKEEKEAVKRQEEFGNWLDSQELPPELQLQTET
jgi:HIV Tat-specific factor 1